MRIILMTLLLGHVLGDFYFQSNKMSQLKMQRLRTLLLHVLIYSVVMAAILAVNLQISQSLINVWIIASISHALIDLLKHYLNRMLKKGLAQYIMNYNFFIDQILHLTVVLSLSVLFKDCLHIYGWQMEMLGLPVLPLAFFTGLICLLKPTSIAINNFFQATGLKETLNQDNNGSLQSFVRAGKYIGMLERVMAFILIINNQYSAIGFLMTAKTITRFKELEKRAVAEYYLIGTLLSMAATFCIALILK